MTRLFRFFRCIQRPVNVLASSWLGVFISLRYPVLVLQCTSCYRELWRPQEDSPFLCHFQWRCYLCGVVARSPSQIGLGPAAVHPGRSTCGKVSTAKAHLRAKLPSKLAVQWDCSDFLHRNLTHPSHQTTTVSVFPIPLNFSLPVPSMSGSLDMAQPAEAIQNGLFESDRLKFYPTTEPDFPLNTFYGLLTKRTHEPNPKNSGNVPWVLPV